MKVCTADQKKRIRLPGVTPGETYQVRELEPGHLELLRLVPQQIELPNTREDVDERWNRFQLTPRLSWEALRKETREL